MFTFTEEDSEDIITQDWIYKDVINIKKLQMKISTSTLDATEDLLENYKLILNEVSSIECLYLELFQNQSDVEEEALHQFIVFLFDEIISKHQQSIEFLSISNSNLYCIQKYYEESGEGDDEQEDGIQKFLTQLLTPLKNLKTLQIKETSYHKDLCQYSILQRIQQIIQTEKVVLPQLSFVDVENSFDLDHFHIKKSSPELFGHLIKVSNTFGALDSIRNIQFTLRDINLDSNFVKQFSQSLTKYKNLKRLGLDLSQNQFLKSEDIIQCLKILTSLSPSLEELIFLDTSVYNKKNTEQLYQYLKQFSNLKYLQIEGFVLKSGACEDFFKTFSCFDQLTNLILDMSSFDMKSQIQQIMKTLSSIKTLTSLDLTFPKQITKQQDIGYVCLALESLKSTLENLNVTFSNKVEENAQIEFVETIRKLNGVKEILIQIKVKDENYNYINVNCKGNEGAESIFDCKNISFYHKLYTDGFSFDLLFFLGVASSMKKPIETLKINSYQRGDEISSLITKQILQYFEKIKEQKSIKKIKWLIKDQYLDFKSLFKNNQNTITSISFETEDGNIEDILKCKNIEQLSIKTHEQTIDLENIFTKLKNLQKFKYRNTDIHDYDNQINSEVFMKADYLTEVRLDNINYSFEDEENDPTLQFFNQKQQTINQLIIYHKFIKPHLIFQPIQTYWDLHI